MRAALLIVYILSSVICPLTPVEAQDVHHHPGMSAAVDAFYSTWFMPDQPGKSCCNKVDCAPAVIERRGGQLYARKIGHWKWIEIPATKIETRRDSPDGQSHVCAPADDHEVYCFVLGSGT
jgi:hypothetical protein